MENHTPAAERPQPDAGSGLSNANVVIAIIAGVVAVMVGAFTLTGMIVGVLYGYFSLQRDNADTKAGLVDLRASYVALVKQVTDGQEKETMLVSGAIKQVNDRVDEINLGGTNYGKGQVNDRMAAIGDVQKRVEKVETVSADIQTKVNRMSEHDDELWSDYKIRHEMPPAQIDTRKYSKN